MKCKNNHNKNILMKDNKNINEIYNDELFFA